MPLMTLPATRVVDPILTTVVQGYAQPEFVGDALFPVVSVSKRSGFLIEFGKEDFALFDTRRAPGAATKRRNINYGTRKYNLYQDALEGELPVEHLEESTGVGFDLQQETVESVMRSIELRLEFDRAAIATNAANYPAANKVTLSGTSQWNDAASKPSTNIRTWRQAIRASTGVYPNVMLMGPTVFETFIEHEEIKDKIKYTSSATVTAAQIAAMYGFDKVVVGSGLVLDAAGNFVDIWGKIAVQAYVPQNRRSIRQPSYGYTYTLQGYPMAEKPYYSTNHRTWFFPVFAERSPELTGINSGFLASAVVA